MKEFRREWNAVEDELPADPGATLVCVLICAALACMGAPFITGSLGLWWWAAGALLIAAQLVCWLWPRPL